MAAKVQYLCDGLFPLVAHNVMHAGLLFALQLARRRQGPKARCVKLDLIGKLELQSATFDAVIGVPPNGEPCRFTVLVEQI
jgi:hypothetical protein